MAWIFALHMNTGPCCDRVVLCALTRADPPLSAIWGLAGECRAALGPPASPDSRPMSKRPRLEDGIVPGHRPFVRGHYKVSLPEGVNTRSVGREGSI